MLCMCPDWDKIKDNEDLIIKHPSYGWVLKWIMVTEEEGYAQINNYGISIKYCPFCGNKLNDGDK